MSVWRSAKLDLQITCSIEYDGFSWNEVSVERRLRGKTYQVTIRRTAGGYAITVNGQAYHGEVLPY